MCSICDRHKLILGVNPIGLKELSTQIQDQIDDREPEKFGSAFAVILLLLVGCWKGHEPRLLNGTFGPRFISSERIRILSAPCNFFLESCIMAWYDTFPT
jgi:hypothetical protein